MVFEFASEAHSINIKQAILNTEETSLNAKNTPSPEVNEKLLMRLSGDKSMKKSADASSFTSQFASTFRGFDSKLRSFAL